MEPKPTEAPTAEPVVEKVDKTDGRKKERSEKQKAATAKALESLTAARKIKAEKQLAKKEEIKTAKRIIEQKIIKEDLSFATKQDIEAMRKELMELRSMHEANKIVKEQKPEKVPERIVERVVERHIPTATPTPTKLSGHALLDKIFFDK